MAGPARWGVAAALVATYTALDRLGRSYGSTAHRTPTGRQEQGRGTTCAPIHRSKPTHAVTVHRASGSGLAVARADGVGAGEWYTARWVDRLLFPANGPSAERIEPELQHLEVGDRVLDGPPEAQCAFADELLEPTRHRASLCDHLPPGWAERFEATIDFTRAFVLDLTWESTHPPRVSQACGPPHAAVGHGGVLVLLLRYTSRCRARCCMVFRSRAERSPSPPHVVLPTAAAAGRQEGGRVTPASTSTWIPLGPVSRGSASGDDLRGACGDCPAPVPRLPLRAPSWRRRVSGPSSRWHPSRTTRADETAAWSPRAASACGSGTPESSATRRAVGTAASSPDLAAVVSPVRITDDAATNRSSARRRAPTPVWGRDEFGHGEMWDSNSVTLWALTHASLKARAALHRCRAELLGDAGVREARRSAQVADDHRPCPRSRKETRHDVLTIPAGRYPRRGLDLSAQPRTPCSRDLRPYRAAGRGACTVERGLRR